MSKQDLGKARGLNSIADPSEFRGRSARPPRKTRSKPKEDPEDTHLNPDQARKTPPGREESAQTGEIDLRDDTPESTESGSPTSNPQGLRPPGKGAQSGDPSGDHESKPKRRRGRPPATGNRRIRRELSVPTVIAEAVEKTGINPADLVMNAYRRHSDDVYTGGGARLAARGRRRLRISLSDGDLDKISRLGEVRNWNRSETVSVLLSLDLLADNTEPADA